MMQQSFITAIIGIAAMVCPVLSLGQEVVTSEREKHEVTFRGFQDIQLLADSTGRSYIVPRPVDLRQAVFKDYQWRPMPQVGIPQEPEGAARYITSPSLKLLNSKIWVDKLFSSLKQNYMIAHPDQVKYNESMLPDPPKKFRAVVDPSTLRIYMAEEIEPDKDMPATAPVEVKRVNWLNTFEGSIQFSQAYVSPNWYQGGNSALSLIGGIRHNIKLNQKFHPNLLFENNTSYKLALASTPDDSLRNYSVTEDIFELTTKAGIRALRYWFYSLSLNFRTQFLNAYPINSPYRSASFLSPGELNVGVGMTYDYATANKRFSVNATINPISYNLKMCIDRAIDPESFGIDPGHRSKSTYGSSCEVKMFVAVTRDITYTSRLFGFTNYSDAQLDWEHTLDFSINRFLSTRLYFALRYDDTTPRYADSRWHHWQCKEILSFGFAYKFNTIVSDN